PNSLFQDRSGRVWVSTLHDFGYLQGQRFISISGVPGGNVHAIVEDSDGSLWIANQQHGLIHLLHDGEIEQIPWIGMGRKDHADALAVDRQRGGLWIGFFSGGVVYFADGAVRESYSSADGLGEGWVTDMLVDPSGVLWAATQGGLSRIKDGRVITLTSK